VAGFNNRQHGKNEKAGRDEIHHPPQQLETFEAIKVDASHAQFACTGWRPHFVDYLFVAFTQSSTFGPTDAPLLARWAKVLAMIQVFISLSIVVLLISRAVGAL
jgi:hypothetical protein